LTQRHTINPDGLFDSLQYGFSQAMMVEGGRRLLLSGQVGVDENEKTVEGGIGAQTVKALDNIDYLLKQAGGDLSHVVMLRIYIAEAARDDQADHRSTTPRFPKQSATLVLDHRHRTVLAGMADRDRSGSRAALVAGPQSATFHCSRESLAG